MSAPPAIAISASAESGDAGQHLGHFFSCSSLEKRTLR